MAEHERADVDEHADAAPSRTPGLLWIVAVTKLLVLSAYSQSMLREAAWGAGIVSIALGFYLV